MSKAKDRMVSEIRYISYEQTQFDTTIEDIGRMRITTINATCEVSEASFQRKKAGEAMDKIDGRELTIKPESVVELFSKVVGLMREAESVTGYLDDHSAELVIGYQDGYIILPRGLTDGKTTVGEMLEKFMRETLA